MIANNYKRMIIPNDSLNPEHPIVVAQAKPQLKDLMQIVIPLGLTHIYGLQMRMLYIKHDKR